MSQPKHNDKGARGFGTDKGFSPKTTPAASKLYEKIWPTGKVMEGNGGEPMPSGSAAGKGKQL